MSVSLRAGLMLAVGSLAVHELRYVAVYGEAGASVTVGHGYLAWLAPLVALALAAACGVWLARIGRARESGPTLTWLGASTALTGVYLVQETVEALTAPGHPGPLADGGWMAVPIAVAIGGLVALVLHGVRAADDIAERATRPAAPLAGEPILPLALAHPAAAQLAPRPRGLARRAAGRAPPLAS